MEIEPARGQANPSASAFSSLMKRPRHASRPRTLSMRMAPCDDVGCYSRRGISAMSGLALQGGEQPLPERSEFGRIVPPSGRDQVEAGVDGECELERNHQPSLGDVFLHIG